MRRTYLKIGKTRPAPEFRCTCGKRFDSLTPVTPDMPDKLEEDAATVCIGCGKGYIVQTDLTLREPTPKEKNRIDSSPGIMALRRHLAEIKALTQHLRIAHNNTPTI